MISADLSIPRLCLTPNKILVSTYTLRPIVSALTIFQNWALAQLELVKTFTAKYQLWRRWGGRGEGGDGLRRWEGWRLPEMENELGHILPILPSDLTILLSSLMSLTISPLTAFPDTITTHPHVSESTCMTFYAAQWMQQVLQCMQCWPGDWILSFYWRLLSGAGELTLIGLF